MTLAYLGSMYFILENTALTHALSVKGGGQLWKACRADPGCSKDRLTGWTKFGRVYGLFEGIRSKKKRC